MRHPILFSMSLFLGGLTCGLLIASHFTLLPVSVLVPAAAALCSFVLWFDSEVESYDADSRELRSWRQAS